MSTSPPSTRISEGGRPPLDETNANVTSPNNKPESLADPAKSPASSEGPSISIPLLPSAKKNAARPSRKDVGGKDAKDKKDADAGARTASPATASPAIDPLSHHIFTRTNTNHSIASRLRNTGRPDSPANEALPRPSSDLSVRRPTPQQDLARDKRKGPSFLSRFSMKGVKKKDNGLLDDESEISELRTEGADAIAFSNAVGAAGYIPHHKEPPRYIRVRAHNKKVREFNRVFLAQELVGTQQPPEDHRGSVVDGTKLASGFGRKESNSGGPIWTVEFSKDGRYLATGGRDRVVRIWAVIATQEDRKAYEEEENATGNKEERLSAPVFRKKPIREFVGHTGDILDLSWSKNNFLLSSSMDKTVRLWHISRQECLCTFKHKDFVTSIAFHPRDDRFFLAGSLDSTLRLWSIPDKAVAFSSQLTDLITAVAFSPDGKIAIAGCLNGFCMFYETEGLKYHTQIHVRSSRGKNAKGSKITGIQTMTFPPDNPDGVVKVLVTSNDSRIRIYNLGDKSLELKLKGHQNLTNQIKATFSDDGNYILCGSEDKRAFIWSFRPNDYENKEKRPFEYFEAHSDVVTEAVFAPTQTRQLLQASSDPIFTLCNPPPITLVSKEESTVNGVIPSQDTQSEASAKITESPGFILRSTHYNGNIIVTTDHVGLIKVFRQDCAYTKRRHESWETGSTFSKKLGRDRFLGRTGSIVTRTSASSRDPRSRRGSLTQPPQNIHQVNSDRINSWRQGVEGNSTSGRPLSVALSTPERSERSLSPNKTGRTPANPAFEARRQPYYASANATSPLAGPPPASMPQSPTSSIQTSRTTQTHDHNRTRGDTGPPAPSFSYRSLDEDDNELRLDPAGASYSFWNLNKWRHIGQLHGTGNSVSSIGSNSLHNGNNNINDNGNGHSRSASTAPAAGVGRDASRRRSLGATAALDRSTASDASATEKETLLLSSSSLSKNRRKSMPVSPKHVITTTTSPTPGDRDTETHLAPPRPPGSGSRLSSELTASGGSGTGSEEEDGEEGEDMRCAKCGGRDFRAKKLGGRQRLLCGSCGRVVNA
ncbi:WD40 repeat-like protein [Whalleya microplaca]|nr:WD40 repeat-like protein [Whalleya microplaca]